MFKYFPLIGQISKEMGLPSCIKTTPNPFPKASHSRINVFVKSGVGKTDAWHIASLGFSKALVTYGVQENAYLFSNVVRGAAILP